MDTRPVPNPVKGRMLGIAFDLQGEAQEARLEIYSKALMKMEEQTVEGNYPQGWNEAEFDISGLKDGTYYYLLQAKGSGGQASSKAGRILVLK